MTATLHTLTSDPRDPAMRGPDSVVRDGRVGMPVCVGLVVLVVELYAVALDVSVWSVGSRRGLRRGLIAR